jgi:predicted TIM-barrel fold metal-dependent hydrolase
VSQDFGPVAAETTGRRTKGNSPSDSREAIHTGTVKGLVGTGTTLMWGSDYPHGDSIFPESLDVLDRILNECKAEKRYEMTAKNVVKLYDLPFEI